MKSQFKKKYSRLSFIKAMQMKTNETFFNYQIGKYLND